VLRLTVLDRIAHRWIAEWSTSERLIVVSGAMASNWRPPFMPSGTACGNTTRHESRTVLPRDGWFATVVIRTPSQVDGPIDLKRRRSIRNSFSPFSLVGSTA
jgi:hypothetical protein